MIPVDNHIADNQLIDLDGRALVTAGFATTTPLQTPLAKQLGGGEKMELFLGKVKAARQGLMGAVNQTGAVCSW